MYFSEPARRDTGLHIVCYGQNPGLGAGAPWPSLVCRQPLLGPLRREQAQRPGLLRVLHVCDLLLSEGDSATQEQRAGLAELSKCTAHSCLLKLKYFALG